MTESTTDFRSPGFFRKLLDPELFEALERHPGACYGLWNDRVLAWTNDAWTRFALDNQGEAVLRDWVPGAAVDGALGPMVDFYVNAIEGVLRTGKRWDHTYECSSADTRRVFRMSMLPVRGEAVLVQNTLVYESPREGAGDETGPRPGIVQRYTDVQGRVLQCAHCRRTCRPGTAEWNWVPEIVRAAPPSTSHGLCPVCLEYHYPASAA